jgi:hypothetical protein
MPSSDITILAILTVIVIATTVAAATTATHQQDVDDDYCKDKLGPGATLVWVVEDDGHEFACQHPDGTIVDIPSKVTANAAR